MDENTTGFRQTENKPKKRTGYLICFILGCISGVVAIAGSILYASFATKAMEFPPGDFGEVLGLLIARDIGLKFLLPMTVVSLVLTGFGIKWKKIVGVVVTSVIAVAVLLISIVPPFVASKNRPETSLDEEVASMTYRQCIMDHTKVMPIVCDGVTVAASNDSEY